MSIDYRPLSPWHSSAVSCEVCGEDATCRVNLIGMFMCENDADITMDEICEAHGWAGSMPVRTSWRPWLRALFWGPVGWWRVRRSQAWMRSALHCPGCKFCQHERQAS